MRAMVVPRWGEVSALREVAEPEAGPGEAVMKVRSAGVGLTLLNMRSGRFGGSTPRIMGHELSGDIVAVGDGVTSGSLLSGTRSRVSRQSTTTRWNTDR